MRWTVPLFIFLLLAKILVSDEANALVGADLADRTIQRYTVVVRAPKSRCTGIVLAQDIVLTAAHCVASGDKFWVGHGNQTLPPWLITTAEQSQKVTPPSQLSAVDQVVLHPSYNAKDKGSPDLAVLKLAKPLPDRFVPAVLSSRPIAEGDHLIAVGYGKSSLNEVRASPVLRMVLLQVTQADRNWAILTKFSDDPAGAAPGDSGGPLFTYRGLHSLVGVISAGSDKLTKAVSLAAHYSWIKDTMAKLAAP